MSLQAPRSLGRLTLAVVALFIAALGVFTAPGLAPRAQAAVTSFHQLPGSARDVGAGAGGSLWVIGTNKVNGGNGIYRWTGSDWTPVDGGAVRIAVDRSGNPWVVNNAGNIYRWVNGAFQQLPGSAKDIGTGADGSVFVVGTNPVFGGYGIYRWAGSDWTRVDGGAVRIAVDRSGNPWVVNDAGNIYRRVNGAFQQLPGSAKDIGTGADGSVFVVGTNPVFGGYGIYRWAGSDWTPVDGGAVAISVGAPGQVAVVNDAGNIYLSNG
jgi:hypothetical protein